MKTLSTPALMVFSLKQPYRCIMLLAVIWLSVHTLSLAQWQIVYTSKDIHYDVNYSSYGGGQWVTVGSNGVVLTSPDGINWTSRSSGTTEILTDVSYNGTQWVAVGLNGTILTSPDGFTWTSQNSGTTKGLTDIGNNGGIWVAVGAAGTILNSPDGVNWTVTHAVTSETLYGLTYGGGGWATVGDNGTILTSSDGITWTPQNSGTTQHFRNIGYGGGLLIAIGGNGTILTSPDGLTWTQRNSGGPATLYGISFDGSLWVSVGSVGAILSSPDGITWTVRYSPTNADLYGVGNNGGKWVGVGQGTIIYAPSYTNALPVSLVLFQAQSEGNITHLTWQTAWERNASHFLIERSPNAKSFEVVGRLEAQGNTDHNQSYSFLDANLASGVWYYRLRQVDLDNTFTYSQIIAVRIGAQALETLTLYPNPSLGPMTVEDAKGIINVSIYSVEGNLVKQQLFAQPVQQWTWENQNQSSGSYLIRVQTNANTVHTLRWIKQ